jgi:hypothetical protein
MTEKRLPFNSLHEVYYHTWVIKAGSRTWIYTGSIDGIKKAKEKIEKEHPPSYTVHVKKVI